MSNRSASEPTDAEPGDPQVDKRVSALIDQNLRRVYSDLVTEDLPDRFKDLLAVLKAQDVEEETSKTGQNS